MNIGPINNKSKIINGMQTQITGKTQAHNIALEKTKKLQSYFPSLFPTRPKKKKKKQKVVSTTPKRTHQTYIRVLPDRTLILSLIPEKTSVTQLPRQIQPQIPWKRSLRLRQRLITE